MAKKLAVVFGIVFVLVGVLGFLNNGIVGSQGFFQTDGVHNLVHLLIGVVLLISAKSASASASALKLFGVVYLVLFVNGLIDGEKLLGFVHSNQADTYLHLVLGIVLLVAGIASKPAMGKMNSSSMNM